MGSSGSKHDSLSKQQIREHARVRAYNEEVQRIKTQLEEEKLLWQQQQIREQHWKESQLREDQKRKETILEWQRQADLRTLKLQQQQIQKELEEHKKQLLQQGQLHQHQPLEQQVYMNAAPAATPLASFGMREMVAVQQRASTGPSTNTSSAIVPKKTVAVQQKASTGPSTNTSSLIVPEKTLAEQQTVSPGLAAIPASSFVPRARTAEKNESSSFVASPSLFIVPRNEPALQKASTNSVASSSSSIITKETAVKQEKPSPAAKIVKKLPKTKEKQKSYLTRMNEANVKCDEWSIIDYIKNENSISKQVSENLLKLFSDNNTIPFIARYRRHLTQGMNDDKLRAARHSYDQAKLIKQRAVAIVKDIDNNGLWTPEFHALVHETKSLHDLEHIYSVFKTPKSKILKSATVNGLKIAADACLKNKTQITLANFVQESVEGLKTQQQVKDGIVCLLADIIIKDRRTFNIIKKLRSTHQFDIQTTKGKEADKRKEHENTYELYYNFTSSLRDLKPDEIRDIDKGAALKALKVQINIPEDFERDFKKQCLEQYGFIGYVPSLKRTLIDAAIDFAYNRSIKGFVAKTVRKEISDKFTNADTVRMGQELKAYLLAPPVRGKVVIGINPGFQNCNFAVVSEQGDVLDTGTIYPNNANNPRGKNEAERVLANLIYKKKGTIIALGNGNSSKETEVFLTNVIKNNNKIQSDVFYTVVDMSSASIYSRSREAALEFPDFKAEILSAVSIARRLQDPMAEIVKIEPEQLTSDTHQQKMYRQLIVELVSYVGVDVNTASVALLKKVAGLNEAMANNIIEWRRSSGPFTNRNDLLKVKGINKSTFEQCAGFIRIVPETAMAIGGQTVAQDSFNYLDQTWIHPESYDIAQSFMEAAKCNVLELGTSSFIFILNLYAQTGKSVLAKRFGTTEETMEMIVQGLRIGKGLDIRGNEDSAMFRKSSIRFDDLNNGDLLFGVVTNLVEYGVFVAVGAEKDGLIHKRCMNGLTVKANQKVKVRVSNIQKERGRLGLTLIQCL